MPLWTMTDANVGSPLFTAMQYNLGVTQANANLLYSNTTQNAVVQDAIVGVFGVDTNEVTASANGHGMHSGWVLRKEGTGGRAGRVTYEVLVASGTMSTATDGDDASFPDYRIIISTQPSSNTSNGWAFMGNVGISGLVATTLPAGGTLAYKWQKAYSGGAATNTWADVANTAGQYFNNTSPVLIANNLIANGNVFRVCVMNLQSGAANVYSANAYLTWYLP